MALATYDEHFNSISGLLHDDLDHLAGTWNEREAAEFEQAIAGFEAVDENLWK